MKLLSMIHNPLSIFFCVTGLVFGQTAPVPIPTKTREFTIPFEVRTDPAADPVKEVELLYSQDRGVHWHSADHQPLEAGKFAFKADADGEYWFAFRTITLSGVTKQAGSSAQLRVLVDATPPKLSFEMKQQDSGEILVVWTAEDRNFQTKHPDFAVSVPNSSNQEKNWTPLNIDSRNLRISESGIEGRFLFFPENGISQIELRASISDIAGNRVEKTSFAVIKPVRRDVIPESNVSAASANSVPLSGVTLRTDSIPIAPPKPVRMKPQMKDLLLKSNPQSQPLLEESIQKSESEKTPPQIPILVSPEGKIASMPQITREKSMTKNESDKMAEELLNNMGQFFEGGFPVKVVKTTKTSVSSAAPQPAVKQEASLPSAAGSITGISLNQTATQPQIIVKWNIGDAPWRDAQVDVLRGNSVQGPWQPIAVNLRNGGEYWWFLTLEDLKPFFIMVRIRSVHGGGSDVTQSPIEIPPKLLGR